MKLAIIILAGGQSKRMGVDKSTLEINGASMLQHTLNRLPKNFEIAINANGDVSRFGKLEYEIISDSIANYAGPLAGILAGMEWAQNHFTHIVTIPIDSIFFPKNLIEKFIAASNNEAKIILASSNQKLHPVFAMLDISLAADLRNFLQQQQSRKIMDFVNRHQWQQVDFALEGGLDLFFNINKQADLEFAKQHLMEQQR